MPAFSDKGYARCIFLDFRECFDTLSRSIAIDKLDKYGMCDTPLELMKSYFSDRLQYVLYGDTKSSITAQEIGLSRLTKNLSKLMRNQNRPMRDPNKPIRNPNRPMSNPNKLMSNPHKHMSDVVQG